MSLTSLVSRRLQRRRLDRTAGGAVGFDNYRPGRRRPTRAVPAGWFPWLHRSDGQ